MYLYTAAHDNISVDLVCQTHTSIVVDVGSVDTCGPTLQASEAGDRTATATTVPWQGSVALCIVAGSAEG